MSASRHRKDPFSLLFRPGSGVSPPVLAGRDRERKRVGAFLRGLREGEAISQDVIIHGPRGNGKTSLLNQFRVDCAATGGARPTFVGLRGGRLASLDNLRAALRPRTKRAIASAWLQNLRSARLLSAGVEMGRSTPATLVDALRARLDKEPLVVAVDEAHLLRKDVGQALLNASEMVRGEVRPFLLLLAGTPGLKAALATMDSTFWERSAKLPIGRLTEEAAEEALTSPLKSLGVSFSDRALETAMSDVVRYPFFVQLWGHALTETKADMESNPVVSANDADEASAAFDMENTAFYADRHAELLRQDLIPAARAVARAHARGALRTREDLSEIVAAAFEGAPAPDAREAAARLEELDYVWQAARRMEPGIPSLMSYIVEEAELTAARPAGA